MRTKKNVFSEFAEKMFSLTIGFIFLASGLAWIAWMLCALFNQKLRATVRRNVFLHCAWFISLPFAGILILPQWPPLWLERRAQRSTALARVQSAGGWEAIMRDCVALTHRHEEEGLRWSRTNDTGLLIPAALKKLDPSDIAYEPIDKPGTSINIIRLKIFGNATPGRRPVPYYGFEVVFGSNAANYLPKPRSGVLGEGFSTNQTVANNIYEIY